MSGTWDLVVVGGGTAGLVTAQTAASLGARVVLVERDRTGGDCLWTGCVPSKALIAAAARASEARDVSRLGVRIEGVEVDFAAVMKHVHGAIRAIEPTDSPAALEEAGVKVMHGHLTFTGRHTAVVDSDTTLDFGQAVICTGSKPALPPIPGLAEADPLTTETVWDLRELPRRLVVLGGGNTGCELGQAFARLGSEVTIVESQDTILSDESGGAASLVSDSLRRDGITLRTGTSASRLSPSPSGGELVLDDDTKVQFDRLLVVVGRTPSSDRLGLEHTGVARDGRGFVVVDRNLRTTAPNIWAAGDVTGLPQLTHLAGFAGSLAASNAVLGVRRGLDLSALPRVTYTDPEVASVGVGPEEAAEKPELSVVAWDHAGVDRAVAEGDVEGTTQLVLDPKGRIVGGTVVGPRAGETLGELTVAVRQGLRTRDLAMTMHAYPTYNDGLWNATIDDVRARLAKLATGKAVRALVAARRRYVSLTRQDQ